MSQATPAAEAYELEAPRPVTARQRIESLDVIRGVALFGILLMNIAAFGLPMMAYNDPSIIGGDAGADLAAWVINSLLFEGTMRGMFSLLFGAGMVVLTARLEASGAGLKTADIYYRRLLWLVLFGFIDAYFLLWFGDILWLYGIVGLFLFPFRVLPPRHLMLAGVIALAGMVLWNQVDNDRYGQKYDAWQAAMAAEADGLELDEDQQAAVEAWEAVEAEYKPDAETLQAEIDAHRGGYLDLLAFNAGMVAWWHTWGTYRWGFLDVFGMMLIGMALLKAGFLTLERRSRDYWLMVGVGYGVGLLVNAREVTMLVDAGFTIPAFFESAVTYDLGRLAMTMGHVGLLLLWCRSGAVGVLQRSLAAVGRMALTNYIAQAVICIAVFSGFGLGQFAEWPRHQLYWLVFGIWLAQLVWSPLWLTRFRFGPLEWLWRSLTYWKRQPLRRRPAVGDPAAA